MFEKLLKWMRLHGVAITNEEEVILRDNTNHIVISKNTIIMPQGKPVDRLFFLNDGIVRLCRMHMEMDITIDFISWNEFVSTPVYLLNQQPSPCALETLTDVEALYWERQDLVFLKEHTKFAGVLEGVLLDFLLNWNQNREMDILSLTPEERYVKLMQTQPAVIREVPLKLIASYLGIHQDSLSRIRNKLSRK